MSEPSDKPAVRASDAEREAVVRELREHCATGRLTLEEFSERADQAYTARTRGELEGLRRDLPAVRQTGFVERPQRKARRYLVSIMGGLSRRGRWRVPRSLNVFSWMGGCDLDFRQAQLEGEEVVVTIVDVMGGVDLYVPEGIEVDVGGFALMGGIDEFGEDRPPHPGTPLIRVRAFSLMGGVDVWRVPHGLQETNLRDLRRRIRRGRLP